MAEDHVTARFLAEWKRTLATRAAELAYLEILEELHACATPDELDAVMARHRPVWGQDAIWDDIADTAAQLRRLFGRGT